MSDNRGHAEPPREFSSRREERLEARRKKKNVRTTVMLVLITLLCVALAAGGIYYLHLNSVITTQNEELLASLKEQADDEPFYMLLLGVDKGEERYESEGESPANYRADTIMLCRIDPHGVEATIVSIHRDLLVELPDGSEGKINAAYSLGGPAGMVQAVSDLAGVDISHYAEIDFDAFMGIVDEIGGVEVTLPVDVYDPEYTELDLKAGTHVLNGHDALMLCRARHAYDDFGDGDLFRAANQRMVIASIVRKVLSSDVTTMVRAVSSMAESLTTDLTLNEILGLTAQMRTFDTDTDLYTGMTPSEPEVVNGVYYEVLDSEAWTAMMRRVDAGLPPLDTDVADETSGIAGSVQGLGIATDAPVESTSQNTVHKTEDNPDSPAEAPTTPDGDNTSVLVISVPDGGAQDVASMLADWGYDVQGDEDYSYSYPESVIVYEDPANAERAWELADSLGGGFVVMENDGSFYVITDLLVWLAG